MPALSTTAAKLLSVCNHPNTSPNELIRVISFDPVLTGRVLNLVNSAYYSLTCKISSLTRAIILLGINTVTNLAVSTTILDKIGTSGLFKATADVFWYHSICAGVTAKMIATILNVPAGLREGYFVAGLLHDLGKIPLHMILPGKYPRILQKAELLGLPHDSVENDVLGLDHCIVGEMIAEKWHLGALLNDALRHHHQPALAAQENQQLTSIIALGDAYANLIASEVPPSALPDHPVLADLLDQVGIPWSVLYEQKNNILNEIDKAKIFLRINNG